MVMNFDNYSTSFQSLMSPMYNVQANYNAIGSGYGAGMGMGAYGAGMYPGYMGMGMGFMSPMTGVGIGQFNADYLIKNDDRNNNYYARPVAVHKKHDETPTMLGIVGTALGTAALLLALAKGKKFKWPSRGARPRTNTPVNPVPVNPTTVNPSTVKPSPVNPTTVNPTAPKIKGYLPQHTQTNINPNSTNTVNTTPVNQNPVTPNTPAVIYSTPNKTHQPKVDIKDIAVDVPFVEIPAYNSVKGYLPVAGQQNLPVLAGNNKVNLGSIENYLPKQQQTFNIPQRGVKGYLPAPSNVDIANQKLAEIRPDIARQGNVVYTTHTPETFNKGYSIGANAKGADKLQALLAQMNA